MATETPARGARGPGLKGGFLNSTERTLSRCVRVEVHKRSGRFKFLRLEVEAEYGSLCDIKGIPSGQVFAGVACTWLQADPVEPQVPYRWYRRRYCAAFHDTAILNSDRKRHMPPHDSTTVACRILEVSPLSLNLNEA